MGYSKVIQMVTSLNLSDEHRLLRAIYLLAKWPNNRLSREVLVTFLAGCHMSEMRTTRPCGSLSIVGE